MPCSHCYPEKEKPQRERTGQSCRQRSLEEAGLGGGELFHSCSVHIPVRFPWKDSHYLNFLHRIFSPFLNQCCWFPPQLHLESPSVKPNLLLSRLEDFCQQGRGCVGPETLAQTESSLLQLLSWRAWVWADYICSRLSPVECVYA